MVEHAISYLGASVQFLLEGAPVVNMEESDAQIAVKIPDSIIIYLTHSCNLVRLPVAVKCDDKIIYCARFGQVVPNLN